MEKEPDKQYRVPEKTREDKIFKEVIYKGPLDVDFTAHKNGVFVIKKDNLAEEWMQQKNKKFYEEIFYEVDNFD